MTSYYQTDVKISMLEPYSLNRSGCLVRNIYELWQTCPHIDSIQNVIHTMTPYYCFINVIVISLRDSVLIFIHNGCIVHIFTISNPSWQDPQAAVHSSPYFLQLHLSVLQCTYTVAVNHLKQNVRRRGIVHHYWYQLVSLKIPAPFCRLHIFTTTHPYHEGKFVLRDVFLPN